MYHSTRGNKNVTSYEAIINGLADDGGLYVIDEIPKLSYKEVLNYSYQMLAGKIISLFFSELAFEDIQREIDEAYKSFDISEVVNITMLDGKAIIELYHGPTGAFKDIALVVLPRMLKLAKEKINNKEITTILTATSGDTGGATLSGFKDVSGIETIVLYPTNGVSPLQEAQMQSFNNGNGHVLAIRGNFDDCQSFVKKFFLNNRNLHLSSANSINISRLVPQIVYYYYTYIKLIKDKVIKEDEKINFTVPTGNFGDILAGYIAKMMGLPIDKLICASNKNNVLTDFFKTNVYDANREFYKTNSPSMDIIISSNLERLLYYTTRSTAKVKEAMDDLKKYKRFTLEGDYSSFNAFYTDEEETNLTIKEYYNEYNYLVDPHTAVGLAALKKFKTMKINDNYNVVLSTASPLKFYDSVAKAISLDSRDLIDFCNKLNIELPNKFKYNSFNKNDIKLTDLDAKIKEIISCYTLK